MPLRMPIAQNHKRRECAGTPPLPSHPLEVRVGNGLEGGVVQRLQLVDALGPSHRIVEVEHEVLHALRQEEVERLRLLLVLRGGRPVVAVRCGTAAQRTSTSVKGLPTWSVCCALVGFVVLSFILHCFQD